MNINWLCGNPNYTISTMEDATTEYIEFTEKDDYFQSLCSPELCGSSPMCSFSTKISYYPLINFYTFNPLPHPYPCIYKKATEYFLEDSDYLVYFIDRKLLGRIRILFPNGYSHTALFLVVA
jgi:hypothetical protein